MVIMLISAMIEVSLLQQTNYRVFNHNIIYFVGVICREVLQAPINGSIVVPDKAVLEAGDVAHFSCDRGFIMEGSSMSECTQNEEWSNRPPICRSKLMILVKRLLFA